MLVRSDMQFEKRKKKSRRKKEAMNHNTSLTV
jgi:hypothetical protein